jgi:hypothetical protein
VFIDRTDDPTLPVRLLSVEETDVGALEPPSRAIAIEMEVAGKGRYTAFGLYLPDGTHIVTTIEPVPAASLNLASEITEQWVRNGFALPLIDNA